jgi:hypothetical protein
VAQERIAEVRALNARVGNPVVEPQMLGTEARLAERAGDRAEALRLYRRSVEEASAAGFTVWAMWMLDDVLHVELALGLPEDAERSGREALALAVRLQDDRMARNIVIGLALVALARGDVERAGTLWGAVDAAERERPLARLWNGYAEFVAPLADRDDEHFLEAVSVGCSEPLDRVVSLALAEPSQTSP